MRCKLSLRAAIGGEAISYPRGIHILRCVLPPFTQ